MIEADGWDEKRKIMTIPKHVQHWTADQIIEYSNAVMAAHRVSSTQHQRLIIRRPTVNGPLELYVWPNACELFCGMINEGFDVKFFDPNYQY